MTKQFDGNNYAIFMIAAAVVRQPYRPTGQFRLGTTGLSHCGSRKTGHPNRNTPVHIQ